VKARRTWTDVVRSVGLSQAGGNHARLRARAAELGLDVTHLEAARLAAANHERRPRLWTDDRLREAVQLATTLHGVFRELGLSVGGSQWIVVRERIAALGLDTSHWRPRNMVLRRRTWTDAQLIAAVRASRSYAAVLRELGITGGGSQQVVVGRVAALQLDTSHMTGQAWSRGSTGSPRPKQPLEEILIVDSPYHDTHKLKLRLIEEGLKEHRCEVCGRTEWNGQPIPLELDHINGDRRDNRIENLRAVCPNCHAQTDTYCGRNIGRYDRDN
jgi:HNH endonuclease